MNTRKIIHIVVVERQHSIPEIVALCDDGTLWATQFLHGGYSPMWRQLESVPQPVETRR